MSPRHSEAVRRARMAYEAACRRLSEAVDHVDYFEEWATAVVRAARTRDRAGRAYQMAVHGVQS